MKNLFSITLVCVLTVLFSMGCAQNRKSSNQTDNSYSSVSLTQNGSPTATIIISENASSTEQHAAEEFSLYVQKMSGAKLPILKNRDNIAGAKIYIGTLERWQEFGLPKTAQQQKVRKEGFIARTTSDSLILSGRDPLGTLFSVYDFLENELGCHWLVPGPLGEVIPKKKTIILGEINKVENPAFELRTFHLHRPSRTEDGRLWGVRNRLNGIFRQEFSKEREGVMYLQPELLGGFHSFAQLLPVEKYYKDHPDIFPLIRGKRYRSSRDEGQLCTTNPKTVQFMSEELIKYFENDPDARLCAIGPNDGYRWCRCRNCLSFDKEFGKNRKDKRGRQITSDRVIDFINKVMKNVNARFPDKKAITLAYINFVQPPITFKPSKNVIVLHCHYSPACYSHPINDPNCQKNSEFNAHLNRWLKDAPSPGSMGVFAYTDKSMWLQLMRPITRQMSEDIKHFYEMGMRTYFGHSKASNWDRALPLCYVSARLLWDPTLDTDKLIKEFFELFFEESSLPMSQYYQCFERALTKSGVHINFRPEEEAPPWLTDKLLKQAETCLEQAEEKAESKQVKDRIAAVRSYFDSTKDLALVFYYYAHYKKTGDPSELQRAKKLIPDLIKGYDPGSVEGSRARKLEFLLGILKENANK